MSELQIHPAANEFPMFDETRLAELTADIQANGQREAIKLLNGEVLDGRNRLKVCEQLGIPPRTMNLPDDTDPWAYVWSLNGERRDIVAEQRYLIWKTCHEQSIAFQSERQRIRDAANAKRSEAAKGNENAAKAPKQNKMPVENSAATQCGDTVSEPRPGPEAKAAASKTNRGAVQRGDRLATARPDLAEAVRKGEMKPAEAHRQMKRAEVVEKAKALPSGQYRVIYADPPWKYGDGRTGDLSTATGALHHYPTMTMTELKALAVPDMCAPDSVLFLWATSPLLPEAIDLAAAWGFKYKACFVWDKVRHNLGHYNSVRHELLLICTHGSCLPDCSELLDSVQEIEKTKEHSRKPEEFRSIIDQLYPHGPRIELFARDTQAEGWETWGNEA